MLTIIKLTTKYEALQEQFTQTNGTWNLVEIG